MRRFNNESGDEQQVQMMFEGMTEEDRYMEMVHASLDSHEVNQNTLAIAINILEKSFWWKFRSERAKLKLIEQTYHALNELV